MLKFLRSVLGDGSSGFASDRVQDRLREAIAAVRDHTLSTAASEAIVQQAEVLAEEGLRGEELIKQSMQAVLGPDAEPDYGLHPVRSASFVVELAIATADRMDDVRPAEVMAALPGLLAVVFGRTLGSDTGKSFFCVNAECIAAVLPDGWGRPLLDAPRYRDEGWGLLLGNAVAASLQGGAWDRRAESLPAEIKLLSLKLLTRGDETAEPLPSRAPPLPRRQPDRWRAAAVTLGVDLTSADLRGRPEATEACFRRLLGEALADRLQDRLLNGAPPTGDEGVALSPVLGFMLIDLAAHATDQHDELQPAAEAEAARLAQAIFGLEPDAAASAAARWAELWRALMLRYDGQSTPLLPDEMGYAVLAYAQTRGRKLGEYIKRNRDPARPADMTPPEVEVRATARLLRFAECNAACLPALPPLGTWAAPDPAAAATALEARLRTAGLSEAHLEQWRQPDSTLGIRLRWLFALLDRLFTWPEYCGRETLPAAMRHFEVADEASALERLSVSVALDDREALPFIAALVVETCTQQGLDPRELLAIVRLAVERVQPQSAQLLKLVGRNEWLRLRDAKLIQPLQVALALLLPGVEVPAEAAAAAGLVKLATALAAALRGDASPEPGLEQRARLLLVSTPESLRRQAAATA